MYGTYDRTPIALSVEVAYRRSRLMGNRAYPQPPTARWWRRRAPRTD